MVYRSSMKRSSEKIWVYFATIVPTIILLISGNGCNKETSPETSTYVLKFGHLANEDHPWHKAALKFAEIVHEKSGARIEVKVYPNEQLGKELDMITGILAGTVDITISGESMQNWVKETALCGIPYLIRDSDHLQKVAGGEIGREIEQTLLEKIGLRSVAWFERGARNLTSNRPIKKPQDLNGLVLRVPNVPMSVKVWEKLGAKPTPMAFSEVFTGLQQGTIEGQENPFALIRSAGFYEVQKYCNLTEHMIAWIYVVIGNEKFESMPPDLQKVVMDAGKEMQAYEHELFLEQQQNLRQELESKGMTLLPVDKETFRTVAKTAVTENLKPELLGLYQRINAIE